MGKVRIDLNKYSKSLSLESINPRDYILNADEYSMESKEKPKAKDVYDTAEEIKKLKKQLKEEKGKKKLDKEKIAKLEAQIKKLSNQKK